MRRSVAWVIGLGLALAGLALSVYYWDRVPDPMPTHWNWRGEVDGWGPRTLGLLLMPGLAVLFMGLLPLADRLGETPEDRAANAAPARAYIVGLVGFLALMHALTVRAALHPPDYRLPVELLLPLLGALLVLTGWLFPQLAPNRWMGIRLRSTLGSERVWRATHRYAGVLYTVCGLVLAICPALGGERVVLITAGVVFVAIIVLPLHYAWLSARDEQVGR